MTAKIIKKRNKKAKSMSKMKKKITNIKMQLWETEKIIIISNNNN